MAERQRRREAYQGEERPDEEAHAGRADEREGGPIGAPEDEHGNVLLQERMRMEEKHRLEKDVLVQRAEIRETRQLAAAACTMAIAIALFVRR